MLEWLENCNCKSDKENKTVVIKERLQREGYVLIWTHEVPIEEDYRDLRLQRAWGIPFPKFDYAPSIKIMTLE